MTPIVDKLGHEIHAGDFIVYAHALGRSCGLRIGRVLELRPERTAKITVQGIDDDWLYGKPRLTKVGYIQHVDRVVVLPLTLIPTPYAVLLLKELTQSTPSSQPLPLSPPWPTLHHHE